MDCFNKVIEESNFGEDAADSCSSSVPFFFPDFPRTHLLEILTCTYLSGFLRTGHTFKD